MCHLFENQMFILCVNSEGVCRMVSSEIVGDAEAVQLYILNAAYGESNL